jgi:hypothetical protein
MYTFCMGRSFGYHSLVYQWLLAYMGIGLHLDESVLWDTTVHLLEYTIHYQNLGSIAPAE